MNGVTDPRILHASAARIAKQLTDVKPFSVVRHQRFGNEQAASVTGGTLKRGQIVTLHPMCGTAKYIRKAIAQDIEEQARERADVAFALMGTPQN